MNKYLFPIFLSLHSFCFAQIDVQFHADSLKGTLGDIINFQWDIQHPTDVQLALRELDMENTGIEIIDQALMQIQMGTRLNFQTAVYDSTGLFQFPDLEILVNYPEGPDTLRLTGPQILITSVLTANDSTFRDIKGLHSINMPLNWIILLLLLALLIASIAIYIIYRRHILNKNVESVPSITPPEKAHIIAFKALEALEKSNYLRSKKYKEYYSELTYILKQYYENRFLIDALELTSSELLTKMDHMTEFTAKMKSRTGSLLQQADLIKFAKGSSTAKEAMESLHTVHALVKSTRIIEEASEENSK